MTMLKKIVGELENFSGLSQLSKQVFGEEGQLENGVAILEQVKDKKLKATLSYSTNLLIRVFFLNKASLDFQSPSLFAKDLQEKGLSEALGEDVRVEPSGHITVIDMETRQLP